MHAITRGILFSSLLAAALAAVAQERKPGLYDLTGLSREQMIFDKSKLLSVFDATSDTEPMRYGGPPAESDGETRILPSLEA